MLAKALMKGEKPYSFLILRKLLAKKISVCFWHLSKIFMEEFIYIMCEGIKTPKLWDKINNIGDECITTTIFLSYVYFSGCHT